MIFQFVHFPAKVIAPVAVLHEVSGLSAVGRQCVRIGKRAVSVSVLMIALTAAPSIAAPAWFGKAYNYIVLDQDVRIALAEFGRNVGLPVVLSDAVSGRVRGRLEAKTAGEFIDRLAVSNGLVWYFDGSVLHVSAEREFATRVFEAGRLSADVVTREMRDLGLADERFSLRAAQNGNVITVSGPPAYINVVSQLIERLQPEAVVAGDDPRVRVFRGGVMTEVVETGARGSTPPEQEQSTVRK